MLNRISERRAKNQRLARILFFALFPIAFATGIALEIYNGRRAVEADVQVTRDRASATAAAAQFAKSKGLDVSDWSAFCSAIPDKDLYADLKTKRSSDAYLVRKLAPPVTARVMFQDAGTRRIFVNLSRDNRVVGYEMRAVDLGGTQTSEQDSMEIARHLIELNPDLSSIFGTTRPEVSNSDANANGVTRKYIWRAPMPNLREIEMRFTAWVRNGQVLGETVAATVDKDYAAAHLDTRSKVLSGFFTIYGLYLSIVVLYSIFSYARRAMQKEVSHSRSAYMALMVTALLSCMMVSSRDAVMLQLADLAVVPPLAYIAAVLFLFVAGAGILTGMAFGSAEGDVREAYPGKLTSLDGLLLGRVFSSNVGRSVVVGFAFTGWLALARGTLMITLSPAQIGAPLESVGFPYMFAPWLSFLAVQPAIMLIFATAGLLQPLAFLNRYCRNRRFRIALLIACAVFVFSGMAQAYSSFAIFAISTTVSVIGLLAPFFLQDLLAAIVSLIGLEFFTALAHVTVEIPSWMGFAFAMASIAIVTLVIEACAWWRGKTYTEEEVRPTYARHIAERLALQAEISAAREAQLRLLPQEAPSVPGLSICASCFPARVVGGDFYDFFVLNDRKIGIFIAEGGNRDLASALSIALAKGYLMHTARAGYSPTEVVQKLEATVGSILETGVTKATLAYAVVDAREGSLRYARTGTYPKVVVARSGASTQIEHEVPCSATRSQLREGSARLRMGDSIVFYTDGIARRIAERHPDVEESWIQRLPSDEEFDARVLHRSLLTSIEADPDSASQELEDDLTAIVIRCVKIGEPFLEVVA